MSNNERIPNNEKLIVPPKPGSNDCAFFVPLGEKGKLLKCVEEGDYVNTVINDMRKDGRKYVSLLRTQEEQRFDQVLSYVQAFGLDEIMLAVTKGGKVYVDYPSVIRKTMHEHQVYDFRAHKPKGVQISSETKISYLGQFCKLGLLAEDKKGLQDQAKLKPILCFQIITEKQKKDEDYWNGNKILVEVEYKKPIRIYRVDKGIHYYGTEDNKTEVATTTFWKKPRTKREVQEEVLQKLINIGGDRFRRVIGIPLSLE